jgi:hypothetical protein
MHGTNKGGRPPKLTPQQRISIGIFVEWETRSLAEQKAKKRARARAQARERPSEIVIPAHEIDLSKVKLKITPGGYQGLQARLEQWAESLAVLAAYPWFLPRVCICIRGGIREWHGARQVLSRDPALPRCSEPHSFDAAVRKAANQRLVADGCRVWQDSPVDDLLVEDFRAQISEPILRPKGIKSEVYANARKHALDKFKVRVSDVTIRRCHDLVKESPLPQAEYAPPGSVGVRRHKRADGEQVEHLDDRGLTEQRAQHPWWQLREMLSRSQIDEIEFAHAIELGEIFYEAYAAPQSMQFGDDHSPRHANDKHKMLVQTRGGDIRWDDGCRRGRARIEEEENGEFRLPPCSDSLLKIFGVEEDDPPGADDPIEDRTMIPVPVWPHRTVDAAYAHLMRGDELVWPHPPWSPRLVDGKYRAGGNRLIEEKRIPMPARWSSVAWRDVLDEMPDRPDRELDVLTAQLAQCCHPITVYAQGEHTLPLTPTKPVYIHATGSTFFQLIEEEPDRDVARVIRQIGYRSARLLERAIHQDVECDPVMIKDCLLRYTWRGPADGCEPADRSWIRVALQRYARHESVPLFPWRENLSFAPTVHGPPRPPEKRPIYSRPPPGIGPIAPFAPLRPRNGPRWLTIEG